MNDWGEPPEPQRWQFSLRDLFVVVTTAAGFMWLVFQWPGPALLKWWILWGVSLIAERCLAASTIPSHEQVSEGDLQDDDNATAIDDSNLLLKICRHVTYATYLWVLGVLLAGDWLQVPRAVLFALAVFLYLLTPPALAFAVGEFFTRLQTGAEAEFARFVQRLLNLVNTFTAFLCVWWLLNPLL